MAVELSCAGRQVGLTGHDNEGSVFGTSEQCRQRARLAAVDGVKRHVARHLPRLAVPRCAVPRRAVPRRAMNVDVWMDMRIDMP